MASTPAQNLAVRCGDRGEKNYETGMSNDEIRMTKFECRMPKTMTKPEGHRTRVDDGSFWNDRKILVVREEADGKRVYDLEERTARFGEAIIDFAKQFRKGL